MLKWQAVDTFDKNFFSPKTAEERPCPVCGSSRYRTFQTLRDLQYYCDSADVPKRFHLSEVQCLDCFCVFQNPSYSTYGFQVVLAEAGCSYGASAGRDDETIAWLHSHDLLRSGSVLLDAGCYDGRFMGKLPVELQKIGVDIDEPALAKARQIYASQNTEYILGEFETFQCEKRPDVVLMLHVLEHLGRPAAALQNLRRISHPKTQLVLEVPVMELGFTSDINGSFPPLHLTHFTRASLRNCMAAGGWQIQRADELTEYNGYRVIATPIPDNSAAPKLERDDRAYQLLAAHLERWYQAQGEVEKRISRFDSLSNYALWGSGFHTEMLYQLTSLFCRKERRFLLVDLDPLKQNNSWRGITIHTPDALKEVDWREACFIPSSYQHHEAMQKSAIALGVPESPIIRLYDSVRIR
jgi:2-polyprenyl-3-methyl-5-hydroxy-6-metoxy-1,4-benzoquinol methylase